VVEIDIVRNSNQIDPQLAIWGWEIPVYLFLGGLTAGIMILAAVLRLRSNGDGLSKWARWLPFAAPIAISLGMLALFIDLANRVHVWRFYTTFELTSPMSWGSWILIGVYPAAILLGINGLTDSDVERLSDWAPVRALKLGRLLEWFKELARGWDARVSWLNIVFGVALGGYTGLLLGTLAARPAWNSIMLGPLFLVSGLSTGAALMMLFPMFEKEHHLLRRWDVMAIGAELVLLGLFLLSLFSTGAPGRAAATLFVGGPFTGAFWTLVVLAGLAVPLALEIIEVRRKLRPTLIAPVLILIGGLSLRWVLVLAGQMA
jgi:protein NrfD